jgi:hypothetical protein
VRRDREARVANSQISVSVQARDPGFRRALSAALRIRALKHRLTGDKHLSIRPASADTADVLIVAFAPAELDDPGFEAAQVQALKALAGKPTFLLGLVAPSGVGSVMSDIDRKNAALAGIAREAGAEFVPLMSRFMQAGRRRWLAADGRPTFRGLLSIADAVLGAIERRAVQRSSIAKSRRGARVLGSQDLFDAITWQGLELPQTLTVMPDWHSIADLLDGRVSFAGYPQWGKFALSDPIDWGMAGANRSWQSYFLGLEFLRPGLCFLYMEASGEDGPNVLTVKQRGGNAKHVHARIDEIIRDFIRANPAGASPNPRAWAEGTICRRVKTFWTYLLHCKRLAARGESFDVDVTQLVGNALVESLELLRSETLYPKAGNHGVRQDSLLILSGLLLPASAYGQELLRDGFARLKHYQLSAALSRDGVWLENSTDYHLLVMRMLLDLAQDLHTAQYAGTDSTFIGDTIARMVPFAQAMVKPDGTPFLIGDTEPKSQSGLLLSARRFLEHSSRGDAKRSPLAMRAGEFFFPDAGYFVSRGEEADASALVFQATLSTPKHKQSDDLSLILSRGSVDLLIDGGAFNKEHSDSIRNAARFDPASHNTYRIGGKGYALRSARRGTLAGITEMWHGRDWAAARGFNKAYQDGQIVRFVVHLKRHHGLIVLDWLRASGPPVLFEQFWHISPLFAQRDWPSDSNQLAFGSSGTGYLLAAFDAGESAVAIEHGSDSNPAAYAMTSDHRIVPTPVFRRSKTLKNGFMASFFRWSPKTQDTAFTVSADGDYVVLAARGEGGLDCRFRIDERRVECLSLD